MKRLAQIVPHMYWLCKSINPQNLLVNNSSKTNALLKISPRFIVHTGSLRKFTSETSLEFALFKMHELIDFTNTKITPSTTSKITENNKKLCTDTNRKCLLSLCPTSHQEKKL